MSDQVQHVDISLSISLCSKCSAASETDSFPQSMHWSRYLFEVSISCGCFCDTLIDLCKNGQQIVPKTWQNNIKILQPSITSDLQCSNGKWKGIIILGSQQVLECETIWWSGNLHPVKSKSKASIIGLFRVLE